MSLQRREQGGDLLGRMVAGVYKDVGQVVAHGSYCAWKRGFGLCLRGLGVMIQTHRP